LNSSLTPAAAVALIDPLTRIVAQAAQIVRAFPPTALATRHKADASPVTQADEKSEAVILAALAELRPDIPVLSEERVSHGETPRLGRAFFIVDPLDGTKEFVAGTDQYTVNLALVSDGIPLLGIIAAPAHDRLWRGVVGAGAQTLRLANGEAVDPQPIRCRRWPSAGSTPVALVSRSHLDADTAAYLDRLGSLERRPSGSAIKFCHIAAGEADIYPRLATTCEWDVAAGQALLAAAGGCVTAPQGLPLAYGRAEVNFRVPAFIACGDPDKARSLWLAPAG
jgi:3'(2'), 5'-bisphosphate nucleotidase